MKSTLAILMLALLIACASENTYRFGAVLQLSGPQAFYGNLAKYGIELAVEDINAQGGINGRRVIAIYEDSEGDKTKAVTAAQKLINVDNVDALFTITPQMAGAVAPIAEENKVPYIYIGSVDTFAQGKKYVFKDYPSPLLLCEILMKQAEQDGHERIALFGQNSEVTTLCKEGAEHVKLLAGFELYNQGETDFRTQFTKIKEGNHTALFLYALEPDCASAFKQISELGLNVQLYLPVQSFACGSDKNTEANKNLFSNAYGSDILLDEQSADPVFTSFKERLESRNWKTHIRGSALLYDVVMEMKKAYTGCETTDCVADNIRALKMRGVTGNISYNGDQIVEREVMLVRFDEGWKKA